MLEQIGLKLVRLDLPFRLNHVNCLLAEGEKGWIVIDTGLNNRYSKERWKEELDGKEVSDIFVTHYHPDHFGYAGGLQQETGAKVSMPKIDAENGLKVWTDQFLKELHGHYALAGIPKSVATAMVENTREFVPRVTPYPKITHYFQEGERFQIGKLEYEVLFTPGHSDGLIVFYNRDQKVLIATDHILPKITPNISYWFHGDPNPLATYLQSLQKIEKLAVDFVIPGHGKPFYGANGRIEEIKKHHETRLNKTLDALKKKSTVYEISKVLFPNIETIHETRFAIGETVAHLEYLRLKGEIHREQKDGHFYYFV
ncbi:MBL fold metallo-hydrolase [Fervidibacillus halotolerans]|uniref:MBL fold metallo-hydrolase n=1 Tax=Fervidibacillus halotolerans TaxID=2980027 RepID=A0A9E8LZ40_9BACI|nr:MBL fold metallo-hydrolase [Fervidibacillus halotolerans]WAA12067.1 MBL fold metallo-hydrolase [Fervidibacillus halotolerans]